MRNDRYVRLTVLGSTRAADVVLPTELSPVALVPELLELLGDRGEPTRFGLFTDTGRRLVHDEPLAGQGLIDGRRLRLAPVADAPAEPVVHDIVDRISGYEVSGLWSPVTRPWVLGLLGATLLLVTAWMVRGHVDLTWSTGVLTALAAVAHLVRSGPASWLLAGSAGLVGAVAAVVDPPPVQGPWGWLVLVLGVLLLVTGLLTRRLAAALTAVVVLLALTAVVIVCTMLGANVVETAGVLGVVALLALGLLPRASMVGSGFYAVAEAVAADEQVSVRSVDAVVAQAYAALTATTVVVATAAAGALWVLAREVLTDVWVAILYGVLAVAMVVRTRHLPLAAHRLATFAAVLVGLVALFVQASRVWPELLPVLAGAAVLLSLALMLLPSPVAGNELRAAQGRRVAGVLERVCILASVPALVGVFGLYGDLLRSF